MKWVIVVLLATMGGDIYVFTKPTFDTKQECVTSIKDPEKIPEYSKKLVMEYGRLMPIRSVGCIEETDLKRILEGQNKL